MNIRAVFHLISYLLIFIGLAIGLCWGVSVGYDDPAIAQSGLSISAVMVILAASLLWLTTRTDMNLSRRDGFGIVTFGWLCVAAAELP